jgi:hypothetical protein
MFLLLDCLVVCCIELLLGMQIVSVQFQFVVISTGAFSMAVPLEVAIIALRCQAI